ncbi:DUF3427 domain-containing protein [Megasphaera sp.]|uniref:DUF3427 domain-containing protein n=1 Tax=Megasphaera sp. TaxID=2023260 RepID=UPI00352173E7
MAEYGALEQCLREGFIDYTIEADQRYVPKILTNNKEKKRKVLDTILSQLYTCDSFLFSVAFLTKSGIACLKDALIQNQAAKGKILASQYLNFTEPGALRELLKFPNVELRMVTEERAFHAKGYLFHRPQAGPENYTMVIGSSNMTANALTHNQEWNVFFTSAENGALIRQTKAEFDALWDAAEIVDEAWIRAYEDVYTKNKPQRQHAYLPFHKIQPNAMQKAALAGIQALRDKGEDRGLLISATGTGKTYLSAFDVQKMQPRRFLFVVHRELIVKSARDSYVRVGVPPEDTGILTGHAKEMDKPYLFATIQTLAQDDILHTFAPDAFDYIVMDEVHHGGAATYQKVLNYFQPKFLLGMTATPERSDNFDIYALFNHNIAYEIRLHDALEENMLVPFHYHGISEISVNGKLLDDMSDFNLLTCEERVRHILHYADLYGSDAERVKGLVFCRNIAEAQALAEAFRQHGKRAVALTGASSEKERSEAITHLEAKSDDDDAYLDYIFTCDIFNEGVDIPQVNQVIMLRPTTSAIVFVQQLGRGLRKYPHKRYLEVLDFIGNYENNFLLPIALFGDRTYNKDFVRRLMRVNFLPGPTSVHFDDIAKERIYEAINAKSALADLRALKESYKDMAYRLGREPLMMDFVHFGDKDPLLFVAKKKSMYTFSRYMNQPGVSTLSKAQEDVLKMVSLELANGKRIEEILILRHLLQAASWTTAELARETEKAYHFLPTAATMASAARVFTLQFFTQTGQKKYGGKALISFENHTYTTTPYFEDMKTDAAFQKYIHDVLDYATYRFQQLYVERNQDAVGGFVRYGNYTRKDVSRILNYDTNREGTLNGYQIVGDTCPIFVTYKKRNDVSASTKYEDAFVSPQQFSWMTRSRVRLSSPQVAAIASKKTRKLLFVKKSDAEGADFFYLGDLSVSGKPVETTIANDKGQLLPIVNFQFILDKPVDDRLYRYIVE